MKALSIMPAYRIRQNIRGGKLSRFLRILAKRESFTIESFPSSQLEILSLYRDDHMALLLKSPRDHMAISWIFFLPFAIKSFSNNRCPIVLVYMITTNRAVGFEFGFSHALNARVKLVYSNLHTL